MFRRLMLLFLAAMLLAVCRGEPAPRVVAADEIHFSDLPTLDAKRVAKAKFEALQTKPEELARSKARAARQIYQERYKEFLAGRGTLDFLLAASVRAMEAELAVADSELDRLAVLERTWLMAWETERIEQARYEAGRIPIQDYLEAKYARIDAELRFVEARAKMGKK